MSSNSTRAPLGVAEKRLQLLRLIRSAEGRDAIHKEADRRYPAYPSLGCAACCSTALIAAGFSATTFRVGAQDLADTLRRSGWRRVPVEEIPSMGAVFVTTDDNGNGKADHIGLVMGYRVHPRRGREFLCFDNQTHGGAPYWRNIGPGRKTRVHYWLEPPMPKPD